MRNILGIALALFVIGWFGCVFDPVVAQPPSENAKLPRIEDGWRRTVGGWERHVPVYAPSDPSAGGWIAHPHPTVFTAFVLLMSIMLLVASWRDPAHAAQSAPS